MKKYVLRIDCVIFRFRLLFYIIFYLYESVFNRVNPFLQTKSLEEREGELKYGFSP